MEWFYSLFLLALCDHLQIIYYHKKNEDAQNLIYVSKIV